MNPQLYCLLAFVVLTGSCIPSGKLADYDWSRTDPDVFQGRSVFDLMETPGSEVMKKPGSMADIVAFFDYPGSREDVPKSYSYSWERNVVRPTRPGSGINLGNALDAPHEGDWGVVLKEEYFSMIKDAGFEIVRIPVRFQTHLSGSDPVEINPYFWERVDWAVNQGLERDLIVILDFHHYFSNDLYYFGSENEKQEQIDEFLGIWKIIAERYKDYPENLYFELMNEPHLPFSREIWNDVLADGIDLIRGSGGNNADRMLVIGSGTWSHIGGLDDLRLPAYEEDPNILVTFHYYEPGSFSHQGAEWGMTSALANVWKGNVWTGTEEQKAIVRRDLDRAAQWADESGRMLFLGEFGAIKFADRASRAAYIGYVREQAELRDISWAFWVFYDSQDLFTVCEPEGRGWKMEILDALIPPVEE